MQKLLDLFAVNFSWRLCTVMYIEKPYISVNISAYNDGDNTEMYFKMFFLLINMIICSLLREFHNEYLLCLYMV